MQRLLTDLASPNDDQTRYMSKWLSDVHFKKNSLPLYQRYGWSSLERLLSYQAHVGGTFGGIARRQSFFGCWNNADTEYIEIISWYYTVWLTIGYWIQSNAYMWSDVRSSLWPLWSIHFHTRRYSFTYTRCRDININQTIEPSSYIVIINGNAKEKPAIIK